MAARRPFWRSQAMSRFAPSSRKLPGTIQLRRGSNSPCLKPAFVRSHLWNREADVAADQPRVIQAPAVSPTNLQKLKARAVAAAARYYPRGMMQRQAAVGEHSTRRISIVVAPGTTQTLA